MRSSSSRLRFGAALSATSLALLLGLGGSAYGGEKGQGTDHRSEKAGAAKTGPITETEDTDPAATDEPGTGQTPNNVVDDGDNLHPSGKDRSVEHGGSGNQGKSQSDPDGATNGGPDKPGMVGGDDLNDQDGNNGCGNDDDFEDDNNGHCRKAKTVTPPPVVGGNTTETCPAGTTMPAGGTAPRDCKAPVACPAGSTMPAGGTEASDCETTVTAVGVTPGAVLGTEMQNPAAATLPATEIPTRVLGETFERASVQTPAAPASAPAAAAAVLGATLARTGLNALTLALIGLALVLFGVAVRRSA